MTQALINRYQPGGDIYVTLTTTRGQAVADAAAQAALSGDETRINSALVQAEYGNPLNTSTASILMQQLAVNPLGAPANWFNGLLKNTVADLISNPMILVGIGIAAFIYFGGLKKLIKK